MRIEVNCSQCGGNRFTLEKAQRDASPIQCADCGHEVGTLGDLKERVAEQVIAGSSRQSGAPSCA